MAPKTKRRTSVIAEKNEQEPEQEETDERAPAPTPMVTALLGPRMLELRAAYSRQSSRRDRLTFLHRHAVVGGAEERVTGERLLVDRQPSLRRRQRRPERRPPAVMGIRPSDRRDDERAVLGNVVPPGTKLLEAPPDDYDLDVSSLSTLTDVVQGHEGLRTTSRTLENWTGLSYSPTVTGTPSSRSTPSSRERRTHRKKP